MSRKDVLLRRTNIIKKIIIIIDPLDLFIHTVDLEVLIEAICAKLSHSSVVDFDMPTINWQKVVDGLFELDLYGIHSSRILTFQVY